MAKSSLKFMSSISVGLTITLFLLPACDRNRSNLIESTGTIEATEVDIRAEA